MKKKATVIAFILTVCVGCVNGLTWLPRPTRTQISPFHAYVPDGLSPAQYEAIKLQDKEKIGTNLGKLGPRGFKSRSLQAWQKAMEKGSGGHVYAVLDYQEKLKKGLIRLEDVPYMVRGGSWDNSDVRGARKLRWLQEDHVYANGGFKKEQSASILGSGLGLDWTGKQKRGVGQKSFPGFS